MLRAIALGMLLLAACQIRDADDQSCSASELQSHVGQPLSKLRVTNLPQPIRIIGPDMAVTLDWNPGRLNVEHDAHRVITRIYCG